MMFAVICTDKPDHTHVRAGNREAHLAYLKSRPDAFRAAGPFLSDDGSSMVGSLLIVEAADRAELDALVSSDPYAQAGLFSAVDIRPWRWSIGAPG